VCASVYARTFVYTYVCVCVSMLCMYVFMCVCFCVYLPQEKVDRGFDIDNFDGKHSYITEVQKSADY
jgi:hypothetical protein